jgi:AraC-like DNA-binding protein
MIPLHQVRTLFASATLSIYDYRCSGEDGGRPIEEFPGGHEITLNRAGAYVCRQALGTAVVDPNQLLFFNKGQGYEISHPFGGGDRATVFVLAQPVLLELLQLYDPDVAAHADRPFTRSHLPVPIEVSAGLRLFPYTLLSVGAGDGSAIEPLAVEAPALAFLERLFTGYGVPQAYSRSRHEHAELAETIKFVLNGRFRRPLSLAEIAAAAHASPFHLCRVFKRETKITINRYLQQLRLLSAAEQMLEDHAADLATIALDNGFASHSHLSTSFRQAFGLAPSAFRRSAGGRTLEQMSKILKA